MGERSTGQKKKKQIDAREGKKINIYSLRSTLLPEPPLVLLDHLAVAPRRVVLRLEVAQLPRVEGRPGPDERAQLPHWPTVRAVPFLVVRVLVKRLPDHPVPRVEQFGARYLMLEVGLRQAIRPASRKVGKGLLLRALALAVVPQIARFPGLNDDIEGRRAVLGVADRRDLPHEVVRVVLGPYREAGVAAAPSIEAELAEPVRVDGGVGREVGVGAVVAGDCGMGAGGSGRRRRAEKREQRAAVGGARPPAWPPKKLNC
jgi:hypothetical protein